MGLLDLALGGTKDDQGNRTKWGYGEGENRVSAFRDMFDGGGAGRSGDRFQGGPLSGALNTIGIRPAGYRDRLAAREAMPAPVARSSAPTSSPVPQMRPVRTTPNFVRDADYGMGGVNPDAFDPRGDYYSHVLSQIMQQGQADPLAVLQQYDAPIGPVAPVTEGMSLPQDAAHMYNYMLSLGVAPSEATRSYSAFYPMGAR